LVRAFVVTPIVFLGSLAITILSPLLHLFLAMVDLVDRRNWRFTRVGGLGIAFCVVEVFGLAMAFIIWVGSGFGLWMRTEPFRRLNMWVLDMWLEMITRAIRAFIGFDFAFPSDDLMTGPVLVFSRHAGPGDALLVARSLTRDHGRRLRMLGTTKLLWDPFFNHLVNRLPFYFCEPNPRDPADQLRELRSAVASIEEDGAMIIFPEGGNFTPRRQKAALDRLAERGDDHLERAAKMRHVLPPRTGGTLAALEAAMTAHILFVAHVGLDDLLSLSDIWHNVPLNRTVQATYWYAERKPGQTSRAEMVDWLYDQWEQVDEWIEKESSSVFGE
jgi:1-acyl-sn-glycerol-3-phosphate acyltransferase